MVLREGFEPPSSGLQPNAKPSQLPQHVGCLPPSSAGLAWLRFARTHPFGMEPVKGVEPSNSRLQGERTPTGATPARNAPDASWSPPSSWEHFRWSRRRGSNSPYQGGSLGCHRQHFACKMEPSWKRTYRPQPNPFHLRTPEEVTRHDWGRAKGYHPRLRRILGTHPAWSGRRGSNPQPRPWQGRALPIELHPQVTHSALPRPRPPEVARLATGP